ncbi:MAG: hypothetical protein OXB88_08050, partial [Bacteriovoracales bacterium]|nr:hypothetical protein [Bacteriovoracales bacterium]
MAKIVRKYSYRRPYSLDLVPLTIRENPHIKNPDLIRPGDKLHIPIIYIGDKKEISQKKYKCPDILSLHKKKPFIVRGKEAKYKKKGDQFVFFPGLSMDEIKRPLSSSPEPYNNLKSIVQKRQPKPKTYQWPLSKFQKQKEIKEREDKTLTKKFPPQPYKGRVPSQVLDLAQDQKSDSKVFAPKKQPRPKT